MIDHLTARRVMATSVDFTLDGEDTAALDDHLRSCSACRTFDASLRTDAATLRELDFGPLPVAVRANIAIAAERQGTGLGRWFALVAVGALLLAGLGSGILGAGGSRSAGPGPDGNAVHWQTEVVDLQAADFWIEANGQRFTAAGHSISVISDPGTPTYRTLEVTWLEHDVEMRLNLYFGADRSDWWVSEIRIYDGKADGEWVTWGGAWFTTPVGAAWTGDLDLDADGGSLHLAGLVLRPVAFDGVNEPAVGADPAPAGASAMPDGSGLAGKGPTPTISP